MNNSNTLTIDLNEEYKIKIEKPSELSNSFFADIYRQAGEAANDILKKSYEKKRTDIKHFKKQDKEYNNIITFCGDRGTGKSSAMLSFANSLMQIDDCKEIYDETDLKNYQFFHIDVIDPSMFEEKENIFEVVLAQLFSSFENKLKDNNHDGNHEKRRKILELFEKVYDNLKTIQKNGEKYNGEALETLSKLSCGANLRNNFKDLIKNYLDYLKKNKDSKACLIIPIDDFDLNIKAVADMAEQIRKYLMIPKVIILMAADIKQLSDAKEQSVRKDFETLIKAESITESPKSITSKYLLKLIPEQRRLFLPTVEVNGKKIRFEIKKSDTTLDNNETIEEYILRTIYEKTELIFIKPDYKLSYFVPRTLRELKEFVIFLNGLSNCSKRENLVLFKEYFIQNWCANNLTPDLIKLIEEWLNLEYTERNKYFITESLEIIREVFIKKFPKSSYSTELKQVLKWFGVYSESINDISSRENYSVNISLGDVLLIIKQLEFVNNIEINRFCFAIKTLYSIEMLSLLNYSFYFNKEIESDKTDERNALDELYEIIGGQIIPENKESLYIENNDHIGYDILPRQRVSFIEKNNNTINKTNLISRQSFNVDYKDFYFMDSKQIKLEETIFETDKFNEFIDTARLFLSYFLGKKISLDKLKEVKIEETLLFQFFLIHMGDDYSFRRKKERIYYNSNLSFYKLHKIAKFDLLAILWTSIFPENIWDRNHLKPYEFCSIFKSMIDARRNNILLFPIHSIDLVNKILSKQNFQNIPSIEDTLHESLTSILKKIKSDVDKLDLDYLKYDLSKLDECNFNPYIEITLTDIEKNRIYSTNNMLEQTNISFLMDEIIQDIKYSPIWYNVKNEIDIINTEGISKLNSWNTKIREIIRGIKEIENNDKDKSIIDILNLSKITEQDINPKYIKNRQVSSEIEKSLYIDKHKKSEIIHSKYKLLKSIFNEQY